MTRVDAALGWPEGLPLERARLVRRYKRFLADVEFHDGLQQTVHCPNSGSMKGMDRPGIPVVVSDSGNPQRKLRKTLELVQVDDGTGRAWVGVNTMRPNAWAAQAVKEGHVPGLGSLGSLRREVSLDGGRIDLLATSKRGRRTWIEVKNTTLAQQGPDGTLEARFPDAVTDRGLRHLKVLMDQITEGDQAVILFFVNRSDAKRFRAAFTIDPAYAEGLEQAREAGVRPVALQVEHGVRMVNGRPVVSSRIGGTLPIARDLTCKRVISSRS